MFDRVSGLISQAARRANIEPQIEATKAFTRYLEWVSKELGPTASQGVKPRAFKNNTLTIRINGRSLATELRIKENLFFKKEADQNNQKNQIRNISYQLT